MMRLAGLDTPPGIGIALVLPTPVVRLPSLKVSLVITVPLILAAAVMGLSGLNIPLHIGVGVGVGVGVAIALVLPTPMMGFTGLNLPPVVGIGGLIPLSPVMGCPSLEVFLFFALVVGVSVLLPSVMRLSIND